MRRKGILAYLEWAFAVVDWDGFLIREVMLGFAQHMRICVYFSV